MRFYPAPPPHSTLTGGGEPLSRPLLVFSMIRYRFFLYAGLLPYLLGAAWAFGMVGEFHAGLFWIGLLGVLFSVIGVEAFNEYFDSRLGTDRVFVVEDVDPVSNRVLWLGIAGFICALGIGAYLTWLIGWPILAFALAGGAAAVFYVAPPIRWAYRGLGELTIGLSYGPWMTLGSLYLQTGAPSWPALWASLLPGLLIMALAVINAIPDFHQDRLVGKRNLVVRVGRHKAVWLYTALAAAGLGTVVVGVASGIFPPTGLVALLALPFLIASTRRALAAYNRPRDMVPAARHMVLFYLVAVSLFTLSIVAEGWMS